MKPRDDVWPNHALQGTARGDYSGVRWCRVTECCVKPPINTDVFGRVS
jgi:hypothetical protein